MLLELARQTLKVIPDSVGFAITARLAAVAARPAPQAHERRAMAGAESIRFGNDRARIAWAWGAGPPVVLVHGWNGRAAQMAPLAARIAENGFRAVAPDVAGHGDSPGHRLHRRHFLEDIPALARTLNEDVFAYVGHSASALSTVRRKHFRSPVCMHLRAVASVSPDQRDPEKLAPRPGIGARYKEFVAGQFGSNWEALSRGLVYQGLGANTLRFCFYDQTDRFVDHTKGDKLAAIAAGARLIKTDRYSHMTILDAPELHTAVCGFLRNEVESIH